MGLMDKVKKILFDEDEVEIPVNSEELPERAKKKENSKEVISNSNKGIIEYHNEEEDYNEEDTITEIVLPKDFEDDEEEEIMEEPRTFNFPIDIDFEEELPSRVREEDYSLKEEIPRRDFVFEEKVKKRDVEVKDYRKLINATPEQKEKKPFKVTPIISPVYGILDKNYKPNEVVNKAEVTPRRDVNKPRLFGPVSYNDQPLPGHKEEEKEDSLKEELVELNTTISELINDTVNPDEIIQTPKKRKEKVKEKIEEVYEDNIENDFEEIQTSGIENEYIDNNNIEDAFESTSEFESVRESDSQNEEEVEDITPSVDIDELIESEEGLEEDDNTIETDLFNLIDSMYKSDEDNEEEDE